MHTPLRIIPLVLVFLAVTIGSFRAQSFNPLYLEDQLYVQVQPSASADANWLAPFRTSYGIAKIERPFAHLEQVDLEGREYQQALTHTFCIELSQGNRRDDLIAALKQLPEVMLVERIPVDQTFPYTPNDPDLPNQWSLSKVQAFDAWDITQGSANVTIAIVDDAVRLTHQDLAANIWVNPGEIPINNIDDDNNGYIDDVNGWDVADGDNDPNPPAASVSNSVFTHGTHCAGIAAGVTDNGTGIASMAFNARIIAVKCNSDATPGPFLPAAYAGVNYAIAAGADIISMSWGGGASSQVNQNIMALAHANGIVLVAAAGNANVSTPMYPASYPHVINVGATNTADQKAVFSNYGSTIDVMAPGDQIYSTLAGSDQSYGFLSGTSMACPLVSGLAGLMLAYDPGIDPDSLENCLKSTCDNIDAANPTYIGQLGAGRVNAFGALTCLSGPPITDFVADLTEVCPGTTVNFTDLTVRNPNAWSWAITGPATLNSTLQNPAITFTTPGTYQVSLTATNSLGSDTETKTAYIIVGGPTATLSGSTAINAGDNAQLRVDFTGTPPFSFTWTDGTTPTTVNNVTTNPYFFNVSPGQTTTYSLTTCSTACTGTVSGTALVQVNQGCASLDAGGVIESRSNDTVFLDPYLGGLTAVSQIEWIGGAGTFIPNRQTANAAYIPAAAEVANGTLNLTLSVVYQAPGGAPDTLVAYEHGNNDFFALVNESTGFTVAGPGNLNRDLTAMTYDTLSQTLYGFGGITGSKIFYAIDPPSFAHTNINTFTQNIFACSFDHDSRTIWASVSAPGSNRPQFLYTVDPVSGTQTQIGPMGLNTGNAATYATGDGINGMAYDSRNDVLYGISENSRLYSINTSTGAATLIGTTGILNSRGMAYDVLSDRIYVLSNFQDIHVIDPVNATVLQTIPPSGAAAFVYTSLAWIPNFAPGPETCLDGVTLNFEAAPQLDLGADTVLCTFSPVILDATIPGGVSWQWSDPDSTDPMFTVNAPGDYWVDVTTANCFATDTINVSALISVEVTPAQAVICAGESVQLNGTVTGSTQPPVWSPATGLSNPNILNPVASPSVSTWYVLTVSDGQNCEGQDSVEVVVEPLPLLGTLKDSVDVCFDDSICPTIGMNPVGNDYYEWIPVDYLSDPFAANPQFCPDPIIGDTTIQYILTVTNAAGCQIMDTVWVTQKKCSVNSRAESLSELWRVYPNPAKDRVYVETGSNLPFTFTLIDAPGRENAVRAEQEGGRWRIPLNGIAAGLYMLRVEGNDGLAGSFKLQIGQ